MKSKGSISRKSLASVLILTSVAIFAAQHVPVLPRLQMESGYDKDLKYRIPDLSFCSERRDLLLKGPPEQRVVVVISVQWLHSFSQGCGRKQNLTSLLWSFFHQERYGGSLERIGREGFHLGGAAGEDRSSVSKRYVEHPVPILQQQQVLPGTRGWDIKPRHMKHWLLLLGTEWTVTLSKICISQLCTQKRTCFLDVSYFFSPCAWANFCWYDFRCAVTWLLFFELDFVSFFFG